MLLCLGGPVLVLWAPTPSLTPATTLHHMVFLPPTSLGLTPGSCSQLADMGKGPVSVPRPMLCAMNQPSHLLCLCL